MDQPRNPFLSLLMALAQFAMVVVLLFGGLQFAGAPFGWMNDPHSSGNVPRIIFVMDLAVFGLLYFAIGRFLFRKWRQTPP